MGQPVVVVVALFYQALAIAAAVLAVMVAIVGLPARRATNPHRALRETENFTCELGQQPQTLRHSYQPPPKRGQSPSPSIAVIRPSQRSLDWLQFEIQLHRQVNSSADDFADEKLSGRELSRCYVQSAQPVSSTSPRRGQDGKPDRERLANGPAQALRTVMLRIVSNRIAGGRVVRGWSEGREGQC